MSCSTNSTDRLAEFSEVPPPRQRFKRIKAGLSASNRFALAGNWSQPLEAPTRRGSTQLGPTRQFRSCTNRPSVVIVLNGMVLEIVLAACGSCTSTNGAEDQHEHENQASLRSQGTKLSNGAASKLTGRAGMGPLTSR